MSPQDAIRPGNSDRTRCCNNVNRFGPITVAGGARFRLHGLGNAFITVAEGELMLPCSLTKRLVNDATPGDVTEGYATDWKVGQLPEPAQRIADRIDVLIPGRMNNPLKWVSGAGPPNLCTIFVLVDPRGLLGTDWQTIPARSPVRTS